MVVDAGLVLGLVVPLPYSDRAAARVRALKEGHEELFAPALLEYEVCSALRRAVARRIKDEGTAHLALELVDGPRIRPISAASSLHSRALAWAARLDQPKACDAQYLALAGETRCALLTADEPVVHSTRALGADWVSGLD
jgi:predicted nucleic acid-binding protein